MKLLIIISIITIFLIVGVNIYFTIMIIKYRNLKNLYKIKNAIASINIKFDLIMESDEIMKYPQISILLDKLIKNINKLSNIKSIYSFKISNENNFLGKNNIIYKELDEEFKLLKQDNDIEIINILIKIIEFDYLVLKVKTPIKYFFEVYLKKILIIRILSLIVKISNKFKCVVENSNIQRNDLVEKFEDFNIGFNIIDRKKFF